MTPDADNRPTGRRPAAALAWLRAHGPGAAVEIVVNLALPLAIFQSARAHIGDTRALMAAAAPPLAWTVSELAWRRRLDALSIIVLAGLALSLIGFAGGGGPRLLQLRERLVMPVIGLVFLGSAAIGRPLIYQLARARIKRSAEEAGWFEALRDHPAFRHAMMVMTLAWGAALVIEPAIAAGLVFILPVPVYMVISPVLGYGAFVALTAWTWWYARRRIRPLRAALG
jgi:hypothetical protein